MAFTGRAIYDTGVWDGIAEDVSDVISMISPSETPLLDFLGDAQYPARSVLHEWLEEEMTPNTITASTAASTSGTAIAVHVRGTGIGNFLTVGAVLKDNTTGEYMQVASTSQNTITVTRAFGGTTAGAHSAGTSMTVIANASLEGADVSDDVSRPRSRYSNYCQIFKVDVIVSGTEQAVSHIGVADEFEHQKNLRIRESLRDLEKAVILGKSSGNTIGSASAYRTFKGLWDHIETNATSSGTLTASILEDAIQSAWGNGADDLDAIIVDATWKRVIDGWNSTRIQVSNTDQTYRNMVSFYEGTFGRMPVFLNRWMPTKTLMVIASNRVKVLPLQGRSFRFEEVARTGDSMKGMVVGEYTLEAKNASLGMAKIYG